MVPAKALANFPLSYRVIGWNGSYIKDGLKLSLMRTKRLLVPVDFSETSKNAVAFALDLAKRWNSKILFVHGFRVAFATYERPSLSPTVEPITTSGPSEEELSR